MIRNRPIVAYALCASLGLLSTSGAANAACALAGSWHLFMMKGSTPDIQTMTQNVGDVGNSGAVSVRSFPTTGAAFQNNTAQVNNCRLTVASNGGFTGNCKSFGVAGRTGSGTVRGNLLLSSACNFRATINVGDPTAIVIRALHINDTHGAGIATQGTRQVLSFTLVKN